MGGGSWGIEGGGGGVGEGEEDGVVTLKSKPLGQFPERVCGGEAGVLQSRWGCGPSTPSHWCLKVCSYARGPITMSRRGEKSFWWARLSGRAETQHQFHHGDLMVLKLWIEVLRNWDSEPWDSRSFVYTFIKSLINSLLIHSVFTLHLSCSWLTEPYHTVSSGCCPELLQTHLILSLNCCSLFMRFSERFFFQSYSIVLSAATPSFPNLGSIKAHLFYINMRGLEAGHGWQIQLR